MPISLKQKELLANIKSQLEHGDNADIAKEVGCTEAHVSNMLNPELDSFSEKIVDVAMRIIEKRKKKVDKQLQRILELKE